MQMIVPGDADAVRRALQDLAASPLFAALPPDLRRTAEIVLAEVMNNIVEHAYAQAAGEITLALAPDRAGLHCEITDRGAPMPGLRLPQGRLQPPGPLKDLPEGGFGWFLIRSLTEGLEYRRMAGLNRLSFRLTEDQSSA